MAWGWQVLFAPLTGCEVLSLRSEGSSVVAEVALSVNLTASTLEQVTDRAFSYAQRCSL